MDGGDLRVLRCLRCFVCFLAESAHQQEILEANQCRVCGKGSVVSAFNSDKFTGSTIADCEAAVEKVTGTKPSAPFHWRNYMNPKITHEPTIALPMGAGRDGQVETERQEGACRVTTSPAELELAIVHLLRAKELAQFYNHSAETIQRLDLLKRAAANLRAQMLRKKAA
jgi:hypothetical protein